MNNKLSLEVSDSNNLKVIRIFDTSNYCTDDVIENYLIEVLPVNKDSWITFHVQKNFSLALNSSSLQYNKVSSESDLIDLADGIYEIKQSYKPNIHTVCHYYHLRTTSLNIKYLELLCTHFNEECSKDKSTYINEIKQLTKIKQYIDAAKYLVDYKHNKECGVRLYNQAVELTKIFEDGCGCK